MGCTQHVVMPTHRRNKSSKQFNEHEKPETFVFCIGYEIYSEEKNTHTAQKMEEIKGTFIRCTAYTLA